MQNLSESLYRNNMSYASSTRATVIGKGLLTEALERIATFFVSHTSLLPLPFLTSERCFVSKRKQRNLCCFSQQDYCRIYQIELYLFIFTCYWSKWHVYWKVDAGHSCFLLKHRKIFMTYMLLWRKVKGLGLLWFLYCSWECYAFSFWMYKKRAVFSYSYIVTLFEYHEILYGPIVKSTCSKKLSVAQCIYLVRGQNRQ